jgi:hypothetical protein
MFPFIISKKFPPRRIKLKLGKLFYISYIERGGRREEIGNEK